MIFKEDWDRCKERFNAFWGGEVVDRCCLAVTSPRKQPIDLGISYKKPESLEQIWLDSELRYQQALYSFANTFFGGEAFLLFWVNLGPGVGATFMGSGYELAESTVWFDRNPVIKDWKSRSKIKLDEESEMWKTVWHMTELLCERAKNDFIVGITDIGGTLDIAVSLRGNEDLLYELYDNPDEVKTLADEIDTAWLEAYDKFQDLIGSHMEGYAAWMGLWCNKRWYPIQCDFSSMISTEMFDEFVAPSLERQARHMDYAVYHLDGPGQIRHLESILDIDEITGIQCVPGATFSEKTGEFHSTFYSETWIPVYKRIQEKGKNLILLEVHPTEIEDLLDCLSPKGLYISTSCKSEDEARELLKKVEKHYGK